MSPELSASELLPDHYATNQQYRVAIARVAAILHLRQPTRAMGYTYSAESCSIQFFKPAGGL